MNTLKNKLLHTFYILTALCIFFIKSNDAFAAGPPTINAIEIEFIETHDKISEASIFSQLKVREGMLYEQGLIDQSIHSLYESGNYDFVEIVKTPITPTEVVLYVRIAPSYRVEEIVYHGNHQYKDRKLEKEVELKVDVPLDRSVLSDDANRIVDYYQKKGYSNVRVDYSVAENVQTGKAVITFDVEEGQKIKIKKINFFGNDHIKSKNLHSQMQTSKRSFYSFLTGSGRFKEDDFDDDLNRLLTYYKNHGFLDVEIPQNKIVFEYPSSKQMIINIHVNEGKQYKIGDITIVGNTVYTSDILFKHVGVKTGDIASPAEINKSSDVLRDHYGTEGYLDTYIYAERIPNVETGDIDLVFNVNESQKFYLEGIEIEGNLKTKDRVILRELALEPGDVFNLVRMKRSKVRLENTRFFEEVDISPIPSKIPGRRNMRVTVTESRTANLSFGAGFSTLEKWSVFTEFSQTNFDLFNYRNNFQGAGQKFRAKASFGTKYTEFLIGFEEPWLFERPLSFGVDLYHSTTDYVSSSYNEMRTGISTYLSKYLYELIIGRVGYTIEKVKISDVKSGASTLIKQEEGDKLVSKVNFSLVRDTRNNIFTPTRGSRLAFTNEVAGGFLGGQSDYYKVEGQAAIWYPTFKTANQVISGAARTGTIVAFNNNRVPFFDRYFLGGPNTVRGYSFRGVGPKDTNGVALGGNTYGFLTAEYSVRIIDPIRFAVFYDAGFVTQSTGHWDVGSYNDSWGFGFRIPVMGAPIRIDWGFPIRSDEKNDHGTQFHFTFGTVF